MVWKRVSGYLSATALTRKFSCNNRRSGSNRGSAAAASILFGEAQAWPFVFLCLLESKTKSDVLVAFSFLSMISFV